MARRYPPSPVVGVGGVVLARDQVLLVQRGTPPSQGLWSIPGGGVELGESLTEACAREILEETGIQARVGPLLEVFERILRDPDGQVEYHYVLLDYLCWAPPLPPHAGDDAAQARWQPLNQLEMMGLTPDTLRLIRKAADLAGDL